MIIRESEGLAKRRLGDEAASDARAAVVQPVGVGLTQNHANRREYRNVQYRIELRGNLVGLFHDQRDATVTQVSDAGGLLCGIGENGIALGSGKRDAFPF